MKGSAEALWSVCLGKYGHLDSSSCHQGSPGIGKQRKTQTGAPKDIMELILSLLGQPHYSQMLPTHLSVLSLNPATALGHKEHSVPRLVATSQGAGRNGLSWQSCQPLRILGSQVQHPSRTRSSTPQTHCLNSLAHRKVKAQMTISRSPVSSMLRVHIACVTVSALEQSGGALKTFPNTFVSLPRMHCGSSYHQDQHGWESKHQQGMFD